MRNCKPKPRDEAPKIWFTQGNTGKTPLKGYQLKGTRGTFQQQLTRQGSKRRERTGNGKDGEEDRRDGGRQWRSGEGAAQPHDECEGEDLAD